MNMFFSWVWIGTGVVYAFNGDASSMLAAYCLAQLCRIEGKIEDLK